MAENRFEAAATNPQIGSMTLSDATGGELSLLQ
jgi:hypothetical protein